MLGTARLQVRPQHLNAVIPLSSPAATPSLAKLGALLDAVRDACEPGTWSRGVELARDQAVVGERSDGEEIVVRVATDGGLVSPVVSLFLDDLDWDCECKLPEDPCVHVAAAVIAVKQARRQGQSTLELGRSVASERGQLRYGFESSQGVLLLRRWLVTRGDARPFIGSLVERMAEGSGPQLIATKHDHQFESVVGPFRGGELPRKLIARVFRALQGASELTFDARPAEIGPPSSGICLRVSSHRDDFVARLEQDPGISEVFTNGATRHGQVLRAVAPHGMDERTFASLRRGRTFSSHEVGSLVGEILPKVKARVTVIVDTDKLPGVMRVKPRLELATARDGERLSALPRIVYGDPPVARVDGERLTLLAGGDVPLRNVKVERLLLSRLEELGLELGVKRSLAPAEAIALASVLESIDTDIRASDESVHKEFFEVGSLAPRLEMDDQGGFELWFEAGEEGAESGRPTGQRADASAVIQAWERGESLAPLMDGGFGRLPAEWLERFGDRVADLLATKSDVTRKASLPAFTAPDLAALAESLDQIPPPAFGRLKEIIDDFEGIPAAILPDDLQAELRDYQRHGVAWLAFLRKAGLGALLADDMGLGKTVQALCLLGKNSLVVAPTSVLHNWAVETKRFRPNLKFEVYHGPGRSLRDDCPVVMTTYAILRLDIEKLVARKWDIVVLDEAQSIKNPDSKVAKAAYRLDADFRICMTGTPVENRLLDLWSQFHFINRGLLGGRKHFQERYVKPIAAGNPETGARLRQRIGPFVLRRRKSEVARELPPRTEIVLRCELSDDERRSYDAVRAATQTDVVAKLSGGKDVLAILEALLRLRQAACHTALLPGHERVAGRASSKLQLLVDTLSEVAAEGHKALVFSQWTSMLDLTEPHLRAAELTFTRLDGSTRDRGGVVAGFQAPDGPQIMLLSLKAGGVGLNLTAADHVFLLDPWWNPATEDQAADRAHRIGQDKPVIVHRLVAKDTVEERILALQVRKRELAEVAVGQATAAAGITREELVALLE